MIDALHPPNRSHIPEEQNTSTTTLRKPKIRTTFITETVCGTSNLTR